MQFYATQRLFLAPSAIKHFTFNVARSKWAQFMAADIADMPQRAQRLREEEDNCRMLEMCVCATKLQAQFNKNQGF